MATYKVPQDVEADDKLIGPFSFRQFTYLMIAGGCGGIAVILFQIFPLLAILPIIPGGFLLVLALPLRKEQPMETYVAALISYHLKPKSRVWMPGQVGSKIHIDVSKQVEAPRARNISEEEASHRLSFLAAVVDSEGYSIKENRNSMHDDFFAEAYNAVDMFDSYGHSNNNIGRLINKEDDERRAAMVEQMRVAIANSAYNTEKNLNSTPTIQTRANERIIQPRSDAINSSAIVTPTIPEGNNS